MPDPNCVGEYVPPCIKEGGEVDPERPTTVFVRLGPNGLQALQDTSYGEALAKSKKQCGQCPLAYPVGSSEREDLSAANLGVDGQLCDAGREFLRGHAYIAFLLAMHGSQASRVLERYTGFPLIGNGQSNQVVEI